MKYPDIHIAAKEAVTCHTLSQDLAGILQALASSTDEGVPGLHPRYRHEISSNGVIFIDTIRAKLNEIRSLLVTEATHAPQDE